MQEKGTITPQEFRDFFGEEPNADNQSIDWSVKTREELTKAVREGRALKSWSYNNNPDAKHIDAVAFTVEIAKRLVNESPICDEQMMSTETWWEIADQEDAKAVDDWQLRGGIRIFTK